MRGTGIGTGSAVRWSRVWATERCPGSLSSTRIPKRRQRLKWVLLRGGSKAAEPVSAFGQDMTAWKADRVRLCSCSRSALVLTGDRLQTFQLGSKCSALEAQDLGRLFLVSIRVVHGCGQAGFSQTVPPRARNRARTPERRPAEPAHRPASDATGRAKEDGRSAG